MIGRLWVRCLFLAVFGMVLVSTPASASSRNYVYVGSSNGQLYGVDVDSGVVRLLTTSGVATGFINALSANDKACLAYYGSDTSIYRWDETTNAHTLIADLADVYAPEFAGQSLESGGGTFWNDTNTYYVGAELPGDVEAIYALVMNENGTGISSFDRLDIVADAAADTDPGDAVADLGGFGDIISVDNGAGGVLLFGATWNGSPTNDLTMWTYDPAGATASARFTNLTPPAGNLNLQLARTPDGRVWAGYDAVTGPNADSPVLRELDIDLGTKTVVFTGAEIPLSPATSISDLTAPACRPQVGIAKRVFSGPTAHGDGTFSATFEMVIETLGDFPLWDLQVTDDLTTEFGTLVTDTPDAPGEYAVTSSPAITAENPSGAPPNSDLTPNPDFDGESDQELFNLTSGDSVEVGATVTLRFTVRFFPAVGTTVYENQAVAEADSREDGTTDGDTEDDSDDGLDPDPDGDDNPNETDTGCAADPTGSNCEDDPTILTLPSPDPQIGVAKTVNAPLANGDGTYSVTYTLLVENLGNVPLFDVRITDDLTAPFGSNVMPSIPSTAGEFTVSGLTVGGQTGGATVATANSSFDGDAETAMVLPVSGESMPVGSSFTITVDVTLYPDLARSPWNNQARATGDVVEDGDADEDTVDLSDDGTDADTNGNGDPGDPDEDDPTPLPPFDAEVNAIPVSGPFGLLLLMASIALLGWGRLRV